MSKTRHTHAAGETIARHRHDDHQLIYVSRGVLAIRTDLGSWVASAERAAWIPADSWHEHRVYGETEVHTITFGTDEAPLPGPEPSVVAVGGLLRELILACTEPGLGATEFAHLHVVLVDRLRRSQIDPLVLPEPTDPRLAEACELVVRDLSRPRTTAWLAGQVRTSERTLARLFRTEFGTTYPQWRTTTRVFHAMIELSAGATVTETGRRCGWATTSAFVDSFTRTMGRTPGAYKLAARVDRL